MIAFFFFFEKDEFELLVEKLATTATNLKTQLSCFSDEQKRVIETKLLIAQNLYKLFK